MAAKGHALALAATLATTLASHAVAGPGSLLGDGYLGRGAPLIASHRAMPMPMDRTAFIAARHEVPDVPTQRRGSSLFTGPASGFFAPLPPREESGTGYRDLGDTANPPLRTNATMVERLRHLVGQAESHHDGYNAINYGAKRLPSRRPTEMTLGEIYAWIEATPGQPHAIGRYQFIPSTLKRLAREIGAAPHERFSPRLQDLLADELFAEAGFNAFRDGVMARRQFMNNLAKIWAGLPNSSGQSHYHGYAGNRATMSWAYFEAEMAKIFPI